MVIRELEQLIRRTPVLTVANGLSLARMLLLIPISLLLREGGDATPVAAIILICLGWLSDGLDGMAARRLHQVSELGKILDPLSDKIFVLVLLIVLTATRDFPAWLLAVVIPRDLAILWGGLLLARRRKTVEQSGMWGKITTNLLVATVVVYLAGWNILVPWLMAASVIAAVISTWRYARIFFRALRASPETT
jgi:CDP-diacylglycerol--glycerol-3-phosphate 3-phosphatidyltransferase